MLRTIIHGLAVLTALIAFGAVALLTFGAVAPAARAQSPNYAKVVPACGTPPYTYAPGATVPQLVDENGNTCGSSGGSSAAAPYEVTPINLDATALSGSAATTILTAGHAAAGATVTANVAYCINIGGTAGSVNNTPAGTQCGSGSGFAAGYNYFVPPTGVAVSMYGLTSGAAAGMGSR